MYTLWKNYKHLHKLHKIKKLVYQLHSLEYDLKDKTKKSENYYKIINMDMDINAF